LSHTCLQGAKDGKHHIRSGRGCSDRRPEYSAGALIENRVPGDID
jgi:hypothetical protein